MEYKRPKSGEIYRHFKGNLYEVLAIAMHTETNEDMVVYKVADGDRTYVRPLDIFVSKVDREKYPDVIQEFRFELVQNHSMIMEFLELSSTTDKIKYLENKKDQITDNFIGIVAQSLDFAENAGTVEERYRAVLQYLKTVQKYEGRR